MKALSLKYKVLILLTVVPLLLLGSYLFLVIRVFENDKLAYIYDTNSNVNRSVASQSRGVFLSILSSVKPIFQEYIFNREFGILSKEIFKGESNLLFVGLIENKNDNFMIGEHLKKNEDDSVEMQKAGTSLYASLKTLKDGEIIVRTPFSNDNLLMVNAVRNPDSDEIINFAIIFRSQELVDLFNSQKGQTIFLTTESGTRLFNRNEDPGKAAKSELLDERFFSQIKNKNSVEGSEQLKGKQTSQLVAYNKIGFADLMVTSLVDKEKALSAIKILVTKSLLFAGLLICITLVVSILGSQTLTRALSDLIYATQRIAKGDFNIQVRINSADEIGDLATSFNLMSREVNRLLNETAEKARMEGELQTAKTVQETLFPPNVQVFDQVYIAGHYEPASECGGDWWYYTRVNNKILLCIGDATGHGAPAALITSAARSAASILENFILDADQIMRFINRAIYDVSKGRVMMTFFLGIIDLETSVLTYCNASHEPPFVVKGDVPKPKKRDLIPLNEVNNARLGERPDTIYEMSQIQIESKDFFFFYTDGIADIRSPKGKVLGDRDFIKMVLESMINRNRPEAFIETMTHSLDSYRQKTNLYDDVTFFCVKYGDVA